MSFKKWLEGSDKAFLEALSNHAETNGLKLTKNYRVLIPEGLDEKTIQLYTAYRIEKTNRWLVFATWVLAIGTLILSVLTLYQ
ncbi:MAG: hypothetical protein Q7R52_04755 [archaeon]|nr:hypothetical protein [archaeon]